MNTQRIYSKRVTLDMTKPWNLFFLQFLKNDKENILLPVFIKFEYIKCIVIEPGQKRKFLFQNLVLKVFNFLSFQPHGVWERDMRWFCFHGELAELISNQTESNSGEYSNYINFRKFKNVLMLVNLYKYETAHCALCISIKLPINVYVRTCFLRIIPWLKSYKRWRDQALEMNSIAMLQMYLLFDITIIKNLYKTQINVVLFLK